MISWRDIRVKYKQSVMGFMWAILMPMLIIGTGILVRFGIAKFSGSPLEMTQIVSVSVKAIPWAFFISSIRFATNSLTGNSNLVTKIYFPKEIFPISAVLSQLFDLMIASGALIVFLAVLRIGWSVQLLWVLPLLLILILFAMSVGIFLSAANLFFRDVKYLVDVIMSFAIFFTPVFYDARLAGKWEWVLLLNPVAPILEGLNSCIVLHHIPKGNWILYSTIVSILGLYLAMMFFKNLEAKFAESI
jgi:lipopolysaccharide transport system permease protein